MSGSDSAIYSYHTFILPFSWTGSDNSDEKSYSRFLRYFEDNAYWAKVNMADSNDINSAATIDTPEEKRLLYKEYQYFYAYARKAIYGFDENIVSNFSFMHDQLHNKAKYVIKKGDDEFILMINEVRIKIFNTGVALFLLECENPKNNPKQNTLEAVKNINDYGRRVALPFIPEKENPDHSICADSLSIQIGTGSDEIEFKSDFKEFIEKGAEPISINHMADVVKDLLNYGGSYNPETFSSRKVETEDRFWIYPLLGDRMYVFCYVNDADMVHKALLGEDGPQLVNEYEKEHGGGVEKWLYDEVKKRNGYAYTQNRGIAENLYELVYVDRSGGLSCYNEEMLQKMLDKALYKRWLNYRSFYFVTNYSLVLLSQSNWPPLVESFLTQYYQMFCLAIAQRASIKFYKRKIASISSKFRNLRGNKKSSLINDIIQLEEQYVEFESQLYFEEVTPEQQGIELFDLIVKQFELKEEMKSLKDQIEGLYDVANIKGNNESNNMMNALTWIAFFVSICSMAVSAAQISGFMHWLAREYEYDGSIGSPVFAGMRIDSIIVVSSFVIALLIGIILLIRAKSRNNKL